MRTFTWLLLPLLALLGVAPPPPNGQHAGNVPRARLKRVLAEEAARTRNRATDDEPHPDPPPPTPRSIPRGVRPRLVPQQRIPRWGEFCEVAQRHSRHWNISPTHDALLPYKAHHATHPDIALAFSTLEAMDHALTTFHPPDRVRPYVTRAPAPGPTGPNVSARPDPDPDMADLAAHVRAYLATTGHQRT
ncbi:hypothetical protein FHX37_0580 [Haloactinospora alba]|uniref:Uncharacterized protein n=1 Tax=Haloactinospora alba TaxID=405555 RepID=A0A543NFS6_9ACTN|nr:hypothetical protein [Haloactinospora alba]TQN30698.1 hypothetical protein FHX37_0580 [Haloactinospora alba]